MVSMVTRNFGVRRCAKTKTVVGLHVLSALVTLRIYVVLNLSDDIFTTLASDYAGFVAAGATHNQTQQHNVIRSVILPVSVEDVAIPVLHLDLDIFPPHIQGFHGRGPICRLANSHEDSASQ